MIKFTDFLVEEKDNPIEDEISEKDLDSMIENLKWEDIEDLYDAEDFVENISEGMTAAQRIKRGQQTRARKSMLAMQRRIKLKRPSGMSILKRRSKYAARRMITNKLLKGRKKSNLSASEKSMIEARVKRILKIYKNLPQKILPKIRELEKGRLASR